MATTTELVRQRIYEGDPTVYLDEFSEATGVSGDWSKDKATVSKFIEWLTEDVNEQVFDGLKDTNSLTADLIGYAWASIDFHALSESVIGYDEEYFKSKAAENSSGESKSIRSSNKRRTKVTLKQYLF